MSDSENSIEASLSENSRVSRPPPPEPLRTSQSHPRRSHHSPRPESKVASMPFIDEDKSLNPSFLAELANQAIMQDTALQGQSPPNTKHPINHQHQHSAGNDSTGQEDQHQHSGNDSTGQEDQHQHSGNDSTGQEDQHQSTGQEELIQNALSRLQSSARGKSTSNIKETLINPETSWPKRGFSSRKRSTSTGMSFRESSAPLPNAEEVQEGTDTTKELASVTTAINNFSRKLSHNNVAGLPRKGSSQNIGNHPGLVRKSSSQSMGLTGSTNSIVGLRRTSLQNSVSSFVQPGSTQGVIPEFDLNENDEDLLSDPNAVSDQKQAKLNTRPPPPQCTKSVDEGSENGVVEAKNQLQLLKDQRKKERMNRRRSMSTDSSSQNDSKSQQTSTIRQGSSPAMFRVEPIKDENSWPRRKSLKGYKDIAEKLDGPLILIQKLADLQKDQVKSVEFHKRHVRDKSGSSASSSRQIVAARRASQANAAEIIPIGNKSPLSVHSVNSFRSSGVRSKLSKLSIDAHPTLNDPIPNGVDGFDQEISATQQVSDSPSGSASILASDQERPVTFGLYPRKSTTKSTFQQPNDSIPSSHSFREGGKTISATSSFNNKRPKEKESLLKSVLSASIGLDCPRISVREIASLSEHKAVANDDVVMTPPPSASNGERQNEIDDALQNEELLDVTEGQGLGKKTLSQMIRDKANYDYNEYLLLQQRHDSINFIHKIESNDIVYQPQSLKIKYLGLHLLGEKIGKGAFGKVKEGICTESLQRIAVKVISKKRVKKMVDGVIREIKLLRRLKHKNIVTLIDVFAKVEDDEGKIGIFPWFLTIEEEPIVWLFENGEEEEKMVKILKWYIVMEFCPCSLQTILDHAPNHKIPISDAHSYFTQLIHGVEYLHSQKVIHHDIKPGNLLVTTDGIIKITDFGIAELFDPYDDKPLNCSVFAGTHQFLPPEVLTDESETGYDGTKVDIWACGVVLYNLISGKFPFEFDDEPNVLALHEKIIKGKYDMPEEALFPCDDLIRNILKHDVNQRYTIEQILAHPWVLSQGPIAATTSGIQTFQHSKENLLIPCETTMLPYLSQLYLKDIEKDIAENGLISDYLKKNRETQDNLENKSIPSITKKISKKLGWSSK